ncbi:hypothetical protein GJ496_009118 [Pomphorhynchus laevis]|nr:hypothetical protein GJ496_009118 [Pomphorhynchus laevis]
MLASKILTTRIEEEIDQITTINPMVIFREISRKIFKFDNFIRHVISHYQKYVSKISSQMFQQLVISCVHSEKLGLVEIESEQLYLAVNI